MATVRLVQSNANAERSQVSPVVEDVTEAPGAPAPASGSAPPDIVTTAPPTRRALVAAPPTAFFERLGGAVAAGIVLAAVLMLAGAFGVFAGAPHGAAGFALVSALVLAVGLVLLLLFLAAALRKVGVDISWVGSDRHIHASVRRTPLPGQVAWLAAEDQRLRGLLEQHRAALQRELHGQREDLAHLAARQDENFAARVEADFRKLSARLEKEGEEMASRTQQRAAAVTRDMGEKLEAMLAEAQAKRAAIRTEHQDLEKLRAGLQRDREALASRQRAHEARLDGGWQRFLADSDAAARRNTEAWQGEMRARIAELQAAIQELQAERAAIQAERAAWAAELRQRVEATVPEVVPPVVRQSVGRAITEAFSTRRFYLLLGGSLAVGMAVIVVAALLGVRNLGLLTPETAFMTGGLAVGLVSLVLLVLLVSLGGALRKLVKMAG